MPSDIPGATVKALMQRAEKIIDTVSEWPGEQDARRIEKARALIELAQLKTSVIALTVSE